MLKPRKNYIENYNKKQSINGICSSQGPPASMRVKN